MRSKDDLYKLVHSLTKAEKRHLKIQLAKHHKAGVSNNELLFNLIDQQQGVYQEEKVLKRLRKNGFRGKLSNIKYLLYEQILKSLQHLYFNRITAREVDNLLASAEILFRKANYQSCYKMLQKAKIKAEEYEQLTLGLQILRFEKKIAPYYTEYPINITSLSQEEGELLKKVAYENKCKQIVDELIAVYHHSSGSEPQFASRRQKEIAAFLLGKPKKSDSTLAKVYFYQAKFLFLQYKGDLSCVSYFENVHQLWEAHPQLINVYREDYIQSITIYFTYRINARRKEVDYASLLDKLRVLKSTTQHEDIKTSFLIVLLDFMYNLPYENMECCKLKFLELQDFLPKHFDLLTDFWKVMCCYHLSIFHFLNEDYKEAESWTTKLLNSTNITQYPVISMYARLIGLLIRYERNDYEQLDYEIRKIYRLLNTRKYNGDIESTILLYARKLLAVHNIADQKSQIFSQFQHSLEAVDQMEYKLYQTGGVFAIYRWLNNKLPGAEGAIN